ncbi:ribosome maturation factor RimM [Flaviaesturariibacter aridisoli]|uniref:Ribosome maturation factor RimM n=1 Tax=Flaviaesturariibacter aridisoli TaxID=2545761 RepID=A0A4R4E7Y5_9BACT|nr:ribosome maturation factor RimM [Flaviaesturariibacter aridisoli]TCZ74950.1 16S rRNA processing protein RimM [Flaviaesturariibacter aridisoli]
MTEYFKIGRLVAAHGVKGELILRHSLGKKTALKGLQALFVEEGKDRFLPWFVAEARAKSDEEVLLLLQDVDTREKALRLTQKDVWLAEPDFKKHSGKSAPISLLNYMIVEDGKELGIILEVIEQPHQVLCRIEVEGKEALIPLNENTIRSVDRKKKQVHVELPEGLLEIYLG